MTKMKGRGFRQSSGLAFLRMLDCAAAAAARVVTDIGMIYDRFLYYPRRSTQPAGSGPRALAPICCPIIMALYSYGLGPRALAPHLLPYNYGPI